jgi:glucokinase
LRPGLGSTHSHDTVESRAAGPGIAAATRARLRDLIAEGKNSSDVDDLLGRCHGQLDSLTTKSIGEAAVAGNLVAQEQYADAARVLGWAIAQIITIVAPEVVVVGGGVSLVGDDIFFKPLRAAVGEFVFPPLANSYTLVPAALGESVVVHGALALARLSN